jgi:hypothetical protein
MESINILNRIQANEIDNSILEHKPNIAER